MRETGVELIHQSEAQGNTGIPLRDVHVVNISIVIVLEMELSKEPGDQKNREYFKRQKLPWLQSYLLERGIQISSDGKNKRKAEVVDLVVNAHEINNKCKVKKRHRSILIHIKE